MWLLQPGELSRAALDGLAGIPLSIGGTPVTTATQSTAYAGFTVTATGGTAPYTYSVASGTLPAGITLNSSSGAVSGTPTTPGTYASIVIRATDAGSATADLAGFTITVAVAPMTFSVAGTDSTLSNGNRTVTRTAITLDASGAKTATVSTGKYYCEFTRGQSTGASDGVGILLSSGTFTNMRNGQNCSVMFTTFGPGQIYTNNGSSAIISGAPVVGDIVGFAADLDNRRGWFRKNGGLWNNNGSADPATNVGGFTIAGGAFGPAVCFANGSAINDTVTINTGQAAYANAAPAGFGNW